MLGGVVRGALGGHSTIRTMSDRARESGASECVAPWSCSILHALRAMDVIVFWPLPSAEDRQINLSLNYWPLTLLRIHAIVGIRAPVRSAAGTDCQDRMDQGATVDAPRD